jgi:hypothetical protein
MLVAIIILGWLLLSTWVSLAIIGISERYDTGEWLGIIISCVFSPLMVFLIQPFFRKRK